MFTYLLCQDCSALVTLCTFESSDDPHILIGIVQGVGIGIVLLFSFFTFKMVHK